jgi:hypothetical protein
MNASYKTLALAALLTFIAAPTRAGETEDEYQAIANIGYAVAFPTGNLRRNPYGFHTGGRLGYVFSAIPLYVGGQFEYFFGETLNSTGNPSNYIAGGVEAGFDITINEWVVLRPSAGVGLGALQGSLGTGTVTGNTEFGVYISPGMSVLVPLAILLVGADVRGFIAPNKGHVSGMSFNLMAGLAI